MKKLITLLVLACFGFSIQAQQFSFELYLESAQGEKDTLTLGYDPLATMEIDEEFGEVDYKTPISPDKFQAFIIDQDYTYLIWFNEFYLKKQIVPPTTQFMSWCAVAIIVPYESLPLKVNWNSSLFDNEDHDYSIMTDWYPGNWFDVGGYSFLTYLRQTDSFIIDKPYEGARLTEFYYQENEKPFRTFFIAFGKQGNIGSNHSPSVGNSINIYPNPGKDIFYINNISGKQIKQIQLFSLSGKNLKTINGNVTSIDCSDLPEGIYLLKLETSDGIFYHEKLIKTTNL